MVHLTRLLAADSPGAIDMAADALRRGELVGLPTETVYGLAADATSSQAVAKIYAAKGRPQFNPLIILVQSLDEANMHGVIPPALDRLAERFWPGPLTLVVPARKESPVAELARAGLETIALRVPAHPVAQAVIKATGRPLAAPSANRSGHVTTTEARHVADDLGPAISLVLDAGRSERGLESTIVGAFDGRLVQLRAGAIARGELELAAGVAVLSARQGSGPMAPGMLAKHYAPSARLRLEAQKPIEGEAYLGFGPLPQIAPGCGPVLNLSAAGDMMEAAANLFSHLRQLDEQKVAAIAIAPIPHHGIGEAINDRLARAALGR